MTSKGSRRYLLVKFFTSNPIPSSVVEETVHRSVEEIVGKLGFAQMNVQLIGFDQLSGKAVFRCRSESVEELRGVIALITHLNDAPAAAAVLRCSGTIKALKVRVPRRRW
jgi:RNase P/RNase MRP subunit POP5